MPMMSRQVVVVQDQKMRGYPAHPVFHPDRRYLEYPFEEISPERNEVYELVRQCFLLAGLDSERAGSAGWNPLGELVQPGETVLLKPNLVKESHPRDPEGWRYILTHGSVVRAVADYVSIALQGRGKIIIADAPQTDSSFKLIDQRLGFSELKRFYAGKGIELEVMDLRKEEWHSKEGIILRRSKLTGDPSGYVAYDLGDRSEFLGHGGAGRYYGADYDTREMNRHHSQGRHEYLLARTAIDADVVFSLPKLKAHKKAGVTATLKNLVGVNGDKNWLPHHTEGSPEVGGDERPSLGGKDRTERGVVDFFRRITLRSPFWGGIIHRLARKLGARLFGDTESVIRSGNWWGNDTVWRMCLDLNKIILYGNRDGTLRLAVPSSRKRHFSLVDGIEAGEGAGPLDPDPVFCKTLIFGIDPACVDAVCCWFMGFDPKKVPIVNHAFMCHGYPLTDQKLEDIEVLSNRKEWTKGLPSLLLKAPNRFKPHFGWKDHVELINE